MKARFQELQEMYKPGYERLRELSQPLYKQFGIHGYGFSVVYTTGEWHFFSNNFSFNQSHLDNINDQDLYRICPSYFLPLHTKYKNILWDAEPHDRQNLYTGVGGDSAIKHDYFHAYTKWHTVETYKGKAIMSATFNAPRALEGVNRFYINNNDILEKFNKYVLGEMNDYLIKFTPHESRPQDISTVKSLITNSFPVDKNVGQFINDTNIHYPRYKQFTNMRLSSRQQEIILWILHGKSESQIAEIVGLSLHTVRTYVSRLKKKFGCYSKMELLLKLIDAGLITSDNWRCLYLVT